MCFFLDLLADKAGCALGEPFLLGHRARHRDRKLASGASMPGSDARRSNSKLNRRTIKDASCRGVACGCNPHFAVLFTIHVALVLCIVSLPPSVSAQGTLKANIPPEVTLCTPVNLTWSGGIPPYRLDVELFVNGFPDSSSNKRKIGIQNTWVLWTPDFPSGSKLQVTVYPSGTSSPSSGNFTNVLPSSDSSCLTNTSSAPTSTTPSPSTSSSHTNSAFIPADEPSPTSSSSPAVLASPRRGLSDGAIAGIAVASSLVAIGFITLATWSLLLRREHVLQPEKGYDRSIVSPAFSDDAPTVPYTGLSSTLASPDPHKLDAPITPPLAALCGSSRDGVDLRPTPYIIPPESTASLSQLRGAGGKTHMREISTSDESGTHMESTSSPSQRGRTGQVQNEGSVIGIGDGDGDGDDLRFDGADGTARLSAVGGSRGLGFSEDVVGASDVASDSGEATLPPPYTQVLFQRRAE